MDTKGPSLSEFAKLSPSAALTELHSRMEGLSHGEANARILEYGRNEIVGKKKLHPFGLLLSKFKNPVLLMLLAAAGASSFLGEHIDALVIVAMVFGSAFIDFFNTYKSEQAMNDLEARVRITVAVLRSGEEKELPVAEVVPGDIFTLEAGDLVPADSVVLESNDLFVNESVLTGESIPAEKEPAFIDGNVLYMGTSVVSGEATAMAVVTGKKTRMGTIAGHLAAAETPSEFEKNLRDFSFFIFRLTIFLVLGIILVRMVFQGADAFQTFLFAVAIAVGIAPELLPMIMAANLARGAIRMSKGGVIVRNLSAIHNFGSIDILCTDKTGTLTEDRIALVKYTDAFGAEDKKVLFWGELSSHYITGIRRTLDNAMREYEKFDPGSWKKVDEIPFDAERKMESIVVRDGARSVLVVKGAPEEVLAACDSIGLPGRALSYEEKQNALKEYASQSEHGFRVLAVAVKEMDERSNYTKADERGLHLMGFLDFLDPPKKSAKTTIEEMERLNIGIKIITGDNHLVSRLVAKELDLPVTGVLTGEDIAKMDPAEFAARAEEVNIFSRVTPEQKEMIIQALRDNGHVVGYMGDGVNDVLALRAADVSISVSNATQIAQETADIILLRKGLGEIINGVVEGRKTFASIFKYLVMALSSNFGNMFSMPVAAVVLPFLPMTATQIILNNFLYDFSQLTIPFDNVDHEFTLRSKKFSISFLRKFMLVFGPISSLFDLLTYASLYFLIHAPVKEFQTGWFVESLMTQTLVVLLLRNLGMGGIRPSWALIAGTIGIAGIGLFLPYSPFGGIFGLVPLPWTVIALISVLVVLYLLSVAFAKWLFYGRYRQLLEGSGKESRPAVKPA